jgi:hypothetical protein
MKNQQLENQLKQAARGRPAKGQSKVNTKAQREGAPDARLNDTKPIIADTGRQFFALYEPFPESWWWQGLKPTANIMEPMRHHKDHKDLFKECIRAELWSLVPPALHQHIALSKGFQKDVRIHFSMLAPGCCNSLCELTLLLSSSRPVAAGFACRS